MTQSAAAQDVFEVQSISSVSATEAWAIGYRTWNVEGFEPIMLHYLSATWTETQL